VSWPLSFRARLTVRWTTAFGLLLALTDVAIYLGSREYLYRALEGDAQTLAITEALSAADGPVGVHLHEPGDSTMAAGTEKLVQLFDEQFRLVEQSRSLAGSAPLVTPDQLGAALGGEDTALAVAVRGRPARIAVVPTSRGDTRYLVAAGLYADRTEAALASLTWFLVGVWLAAVLATGALGYLLSSSALRVVERITQRAAAISRGDFDARLDPPIVQDELGRMTKSLNEVIERLEGALRANRRFAADASHELRSPLTAMIGEIDVALKHERTGAEYRDTLGTVRERLDALTALADDLMLLVRVHEGKKALHVREVELVPLLDSCVGAAQHAAGERHIRVTLHPLPTLVAYADARLLARVFANVLANAVRYNRAHGVVDVSATFRDAPAGTWAPGMIAVLVADSGIGIPIAQQERVFERFYRVDESRTRQTGGAGLGLAICKEVLQVLGGSIRIAASSESGTTVEVCVPGRAVSVGQGVLAGPQGEGTAIAHAGKSAQRISCNTL
jgi:signal transduction histidine kinase